MNNHARNWVRVQIPLLALTVAWPVVQQLLRAPGELPAAALWPTRIIGLGLVVGAVSLFRAASQVLGDDLVASPQPRAEGSLRQSGIYAHLRHPIYVAIVIAAGSWSLLWSSVGGLALALVCLVFFVFKTRAEERYLLEHYPSYAQYAAKVPRFVPRRG
jgi:protein-S-isoprenylcysteine O-methyltransferase Ste14